MMESTEIPPLPEDDTDDDDDLSDVGLTPKHHSGSEAGLFGDHGNGDVLVTNQFQDGSPGGGKDSDDNSHSFVTLSPPTSPMKSGNNDEVDPSVLESLDDSTSSSDIPKSKLDTPSYTEGRKLLDFESPVVPGRDRNIALLVEEEGQDVDLKVAIKERLSHTVKSDTYVSYRICTDTTRPSHLFEQSHYEVWRRYKDFEWLQNILEKLHYTLITPPLPGKQLSRYFDHKSEQFLNEREKALDKFLKRLATHPYFSFDPHFKVFLTADAPTFTTHVAENTGNSYKILESVSTSVKNVTTSLMLKNSDPEYVKQAKYFTDLCEKFGTMERVATRLHTDREDVANAMEDFSSAMVQWASHEPNMAQSLQKVGTCVEACGTAVKELNQSNAYSLLMSTREYQLFCTAGVNAIRRRDALELEKKRTTDDRERKKKIHDDAAAAGKIQKLPKLAEDLQKASLGAEKALDDLSQANEMLRVDIEKWGEAKNKEMCSLMKHVADSHIDYHQKSLDEWEVVLKLLKSSRTSVPPDMEHRTDLTQAGSIPNKNEQADEESPEVLRADPAGQVASPPQENGHHHDEHTDSLDDLFS